MTNKQLLALILTTLRRECRPLKVHGKYPYLCLTLVARQQAIFHNSGMVDAGGCLLVEAL